MPMEPQTLKRPTPADKGVGALRAALGQGLALGWGDEIEAMVRSKLGGEPYDAALNRIRGEYGQYAAENPKSAFALEMLGGAAPAVASAFIPGMQPAAAAKAGGTLMKLGLGGAGVGAVTGAGTAEQDRVSGAVAGGLLGGAAGVSIPLAMRGAGSAWQWLADRLHPSDERVTQRAVSKLSHVIDNAKMKPGDIAARMAEDRKLGVPSIVANTSPATANLAETIAQRSGSGATRLEEALHAQTGGARDRTYQQVSRALNPKDFYAEEQKMLENLRSRAGSLYDEAYSQGEFNNPRITEVLKNPKFRGFFDTARGIAETEALAAKLRGEDASKYLLRDIYKLVVNPVTKEMTPVVTRLPDVRTLDYIKRGIDASIDAGFRGQGMSTAEANALRELRKEFVSALDASVPAYAQARKTYAGDIEVLDALRAGMNDFRKMDHEQVKAAVSTMSAAEKEAFRTGVSRDLYSLIMGPAHNMNAAQRSIGSPEGQKKLAHLFDSPQQFNLFKSALEREAQLYSQAGKILNGSPTAKRLQMREMLEGDDSLGGVVTNAVTGSWKASLSGLVNRAIAAGSISDQVAEKLSAMLTSKDPHEVAAVVRLLEKYQAGAAPRAILGTGVERGAIVGTETALPRPPTSTSALENASEPLAVESAIDRDIRQMRSQSEDGGEVSPSNESAIDRDIRLSREKK